MSTGMQDTTQESDDLADEIQDVRDEFEAYRTAVIKPRFRDLNEQLDDAAEQRDEMQAVLEGMQAQLNQLEAKLGALMGVDDESASNPAKRLQDLKHALINQAESRTGDGAGRASMHYKDAQELFARTGHGEVKKPECYKALREARDAPGFEETTKLSPHGNEIEATRVKLADLATDSASRNPTTREGGSVATDTHSGGVQSNAR